MKLRNTYSWRCIMLVLSRKSGQQLMIGDDIKITVVGMQGNRVTLGIEAPRDQRVLRSELYDRPDEPLIIEVLTTHEPTPLAGLTKLQYIELSNNQVADLKPLEKLTALSALYLSGNKIADITPLAGLTKLSSLALGKNQVKDLAPLAKVTRLRTLELKDN